jgi:phosphatidylethanolamine/phosphatidyl-N-methylethanolamine N-methyltransferase
MQLLAKLSATTLFLQELVNRPRQVGAILPSSQNLAQAMARWLHHEPNSYALELGPGTGSVTEALFARGLRQDRLIAIEQSPKMADLLRNRFPSANIITGDAFQVDTLLKQHVRPGTRISSVVSSLPLLNFGPVIADDFGKKIRALLPDGGKLIQYCYHLLNKRSKLDDHFRRVASHWVWLNLPPARVSVYQK